MQTLDSCKDARSEAMPKNTRNDTPSERKSTCYYHVLVICRLLQVLLTSHVINMERLMLFNSLFLRFKIFFRISKCSQKILVFLKDPLIIIELRLCVAA